MSLASLLAQQVTLLTPGTPTTNAFGDAVPGTPTEISAWGLIQPVSSTEMTGDRDTAVATHLLFLGPDATVDRLSRVDDGTTVYDVVGVPALHRTPRGPHHYEIELREVAG